MYMDNNAHHPMNNTFIKPLIRDINSSNPNQLTAGGRESLAIIKNFNASFQFTAYIDDAQKVVLEPSGTDANIDLIMGVLLASKVAGKR